MRASTSHLAGFLFGGESVKKGYMIIRHGDHGKRPRVIHPDIPTALAEGSRLAGLHPGVTFLFAEVIGCVTATDEGGVVVTTAV